MARTSRNLKFEEARSNMANKEETLPSWARCIVKVHFDDEHGEKYLKSIEDTCLSALFVYSCDCETQTNH